MSNLKDYQVTIRDIMGRSARRWTFSAHNPAEAAHAAMRDLDRTDTMWTTVKVPLEHGADLTYYSTAQERLIWLREIVSGKRIAY